MTRNEAIVEVLVDVVTAVVRWTLEMGLSLEDAHRLVRQIFEDETARDWMALRALALTGKNKETA